MPSRVEFLYIVTRLTLRLLSLTRGVALVTMLLLLVPGLVAAPRRVAVARPTTGNPLSLFSPLLSILPTSWSFSLLLVALHDEAILGLTAVTLPNLHGSILNQMWLLRIEHLPIKV
jgi:hypothetical protein